MIKVQSFVKTFGAVTAVNGIDGLRSTLTETAHFSFVLDIGVLVALSLLFIGASVRSFSRIQM